MDKKQPGRPPEHKDVNDTKRGFMVSLTNNEKAAIEKVHKSLSKALLKLIPKK